MTSPTDLTEKRRKMKNIASGKRRKALVKKNGTTPALFTLNKPVTSKGVAAKPAAKKVEKAAAEPAKKAVKAAAPKPAAKAKKS